MKNEITLPLELAEVDLSLEAIGAIFVLMALPTIKGSHWVTNPTFNEIVDELKADKIITSTVDGDALAIEIDLTKV